MPSKPILEPEDFLIDNTFQLYCAGTDAVSTAYWEKYIEAHPEQQKAITQAAQLYKILSGNKIKLNEKIASLKTQKLKEEKTTTKLWLKWASVAAILIATFALGIFYVNQPSVKDSLSNTTFSTKTGQRKKITLPDGSVILLNAQSTIKLAPGFNKKNRKLSLTGEAFFDIKHDKNKPFQVHTTEFDINVLGTAFNVKAYADESFAETTLVRGLITMQTNNDKNGIITLKPSQKVTITKWNPNQPKQPLPQKEKFIPQITLNHYTLLKDTTIVETAWTQNKILIYDQDFNKVKDILEKWYNVKIIFKTPELENHKFTATFSNENINQVLNALNQVEKFNYEINGNQVTISK